MTPEQLKEIETRLGTQAKDEIVKESKRIETELSTKYSQMVAGTVTKEAFEAFKQEQTDSFQALLKPLEDVAKEQGNKMNAMLEGAAPSSKTIEQFIVEQMPNLKELKSSGKMVEFTASQLKAAGIMSISGAIEAMTSPPNSPYLPGLGGTELQLFDIVQNPNYIINHVDLGRTNQSRLAWINETSEDGTITEVEEGGSKPLVDTSFKVEMSIAKKIAGHIKLTDEFEDDAPQLGTKVRRMLQEKVLRAWDDAIQVAVIAAARPYQITGLNGDIEDANFWDAIRAQMAQIRSYNFIENTVGINPQTDAKMEMAKNVNGTYLLPSFANRINALKTQANKVAVNAAFVGDLKQYKVDVYKEFVLKMGWVNDDFIKNQFAIVGEIRYHRYISDNRRNAICYSDLGVIINAIDGTQGS